MSQTRGPSKRQSPIFHLLLCRVLVAPRPTMFSTLPPEFNLADLATVVSGRVCKLLLHKEMSPAVIITPIQRALRAERPTLFRSRFSKISLFISSNFVKMTSGSGCTPSMTWEENSLEEGYVGNLFPELPWERLPKPPV